MAKSNPIGVRFREDMLEAFKEDKIADSPQKALNFLTQFYLENRPNKPNWVEMFKDIPIIKREGTEKSSTKALNLPKTEEKQKDKETEAKKVDTEKRAEIASKISEIEKELKSPPKNPALGITLWKRSKEKELESLKKQLI